MRDHVYISDLNKHDGSRATLRGWLAHTRSKGRIHFLVMRDGSGICQCVVSMADVSPEVWKLCSDLTLESSFEARGKVRKDDRAPGGFELAVEELRAFQIIPEGNPYPIQPKEHGTEFLLDNRHLWLRSSRQHAILRVRDEVVKACRDFLYDRGFVLIDSPIFTPAACEGTSTLFETDYFGQKAYLTQSGQLYLEPAAQAFGRVFCFGPTFRAEKSKTRRHLTEFWMIEPEVAFAELDDIMELSEDLVVAITGRCLERKREELKRLERDLSRLESVQKPFPRMTYDEAARLLQSDEARGHAAESGAPPFEYGNDLGAADETFLGARFDRPIMISRYPASVKAFYMQPDPADPTKALCVDMIAPDGYGEIIGGSQRIHDYDLLLRRIEEHRLPRQAFEWYLDVRRYGSVPHSGFGMGIERLVTWITGIHHLRETIPYPRTLQRLYP
ncbi:MAG: asparagine--tRNA ligase [Acidobacteria bacterium]|nr:MAG: asparagine--tRNA ligase [Acidobacteriota bacterium]